MAYGRYSRKRYSSRRSSYYKRRSSTYRRAAAYRPRRSYRKKYPARKYKAPAYRVVADFKKKLARKQGRGGIAGSALFSKEKLMKELHALRLIVANIHADRSADPKGQTADDAVPTAGGDRAVHRDSDTGRYTRSGAAKGLGADKSGHPDDVGEGSKELV